jgi:hypothetical protein
MRGALQRSYAGEIRRPARRRKPSKVAFVAIMRKLLILANALIRDGRT